MGPGMTESLTRRIFTSFGTLTDTVSTFSSGMKSTRCVNSHYSPFQLHRISGNRMSYITFTETHKWVSVGKTRDPVFGLFLTVFTIQSLVGLQWTVWISLSEKRAPYSCNINWCEQTD